jgi:uncharacterized protein with HEPN domain
MAESTQRLSAEFKDAHPEIPWSDIAAFRNRVVHGYLTIDLDIVWDIVEREVRPIGECARRALELHREKDGPERDTGFDIGF